MSFQSAIPWRVALRQSLPPLYRPVTILNNPLTNNNSKTKSNNKTKTKNKIKVVYTEDLTHPNFELGSISPLFLHQLSRSRWRIDTEVFQTLTTDCHLKHPAVHQTTALVVLTMIRFLAYTLSLVFYHRQVCSHARRKCDTFHELAKRFAYWFLALSPNTS